MAAAPDYKQAYEALARGDLAGALNITTPLVSEATGSAGDLAAHAAVLKAMGRLEEALTFNRRSVEHFPTDGVAWHNLAATLGDLEKHDQSESAAVRAIKIGLGAPETRLVLARALMAQGKLDDAQAAFATAVKLRPTFAEAHRELAQLIWMRTADSRAALQYLDAELVRSPNNLTLAGLRATVLEFTGDIDKARETLAWAMTNNPDDVELLRAAAHLAGQAGDVAGAVELAQRCAKAAPNTLASELVLAQAWLAAGEGARAADMAQRAVFRAPQNQFALALLATAWRLLDDPRYQRIYDYDAFVGVYEIPTPAGWSSLPAFLADLTQALNGVHAYVTHPLSQSLRHGGQQTLRLDGGNGPVIEAYLASARAVVAEHAAKLGAGTDPMRSRNSGAARFAGAWSVRLPSQGYHSDHVHPMGWLSSASYVALPDEVRDTETRAGWIKFGQPGVPTGPALEAEHFVQPAPGRLVLFPSYMWHGTVPFSSTQARLTVAFDAVPV
ncbi:putative 2OG-Fe(II) oxygenase [Phenylobacterium aquaticum]|uniref:putative 2OG-Fe(II) oxygenase n=1 Tax=Phenylobacterium aquaticum TaxID=1763816 RepID=UPI0026F376DD|nr:putative 2OG-Fe(II) oxygenase [Phenylobacterium aquaticum]